MKRIEDYTAYISCGSKVTAYLGPRLALIVDDDAGLASELAAAGDALMGAVVNALERLLALFDRCVGKAPPVTAPLEGRVRYEVAYLDGAGGLAHHGVAGIAVGPDFLKQTINSFLEGNAGKRGCCGFSRGTWSA